MTMWFTVATVILFAFSIALLLVLPQRDVTQSSGKWQFVWELLAPGTSPRWGIMGGFALVLWIYFLVQDYLLFHLGTPYLLAAIAMPNVVSAYGVPGQGDTSEVFKIINPSWLWLYLAPAVLFVVNLVVVFRDKLFRKVV
jgi:hypothetical protein